MTEWLHDYFSCWMWLILQDAMKRASYDHSYYHNYTVILRPLQQEINYWFPVIPWKLFYYFPTYSVDWQKVLMIVKYRNLWCHSLEWWKWTKPWASTHRQVTQEYLYIDMEWLHEAHTHTVTHSFKTESPNVKTAWYVSKDLGHTWPISPKHTVKFKHPWISTNMVLVPTHQWTSCTESSSLLIT